MTTKYAKYGKIKTSNSSPRPPPSSSGAKVTEKHQQQQRQNREEQSLLVNIPSGFVELEGNFEIPENPIGIVLFAHGSGSSRHIQEIDMWPKYLEIQKLLRCYLIY